MSEPNVLTVAGHGGRLQIEIFGYENLQAETESDANWLKVGVSLGVGGCTFRRRAGLTTRDLDAFCRDLAQAFTDLRGTVVLRTDEDWLRLSISFDTRGGVEIRGSVADDGADVTVEFGLESDQSFVSQTVSDLQEATRSWPPVDR